MNIKSGDNILVIAGKEKGKTGRVDRQDLERDRIFVEGLNMVTRHMKARPGIRQSGIIQQEASIHVSNVMLICNKCSRPTRPNVMRLETGKRVRSCAKCKEVIDDVTQ